MKKRITLKTVAKRAGVSVMTVSNVINGKFNHATADTRRRVEDAIEALGYKADLTGRALRLSRHFAIGMIVVDPSPTFIADAFTTFLIAGLGNRLSRQGYGLLLQGTTLDELPQVQMLRHSLVDGICIFSSGTTQQRRAAYGRLAKHREPLIIFQDSPTAELDDVLAIRQDDRGGGALLARRLVESGCRTLVYLTVVPRWPALDARERGIKSVVRAVENATVATLRAGAGDVASVEQALAAYIAEHGVPDAIMAGNDQLALVAQSWLLNQSFNIPAQVKVTGFNAFDFARFARPKLTTIRSPAYELGELGANALLKRLESGLFEEQEIVLPVALEPGDSA